MGAFWWAWAPPGLSLDPFGDQDEKRDEKWHGDPWLPGPSWDSKSSLVLKKRYHTRTNGLPDRVWTHTCWCYCLQKGHESPTRCHSLALRVLPHVAICCHILAYYVTMCVRVCIYIYIYTYIYIYMYRERQTYIHTYTTQPWFAAKLRAQDLRLWYYHYD